MLSRLFRRLFLEKLVAAHDAGRLQFFGDHAHTRPSATPSPPIWRRYAKRVGRLCQAPFGGPEAVLAYLSRYTHRVAIANSRLIALDDTGVTFRWKDYRAKGRERAKVMTLAIDEFIRRFLIHVLPGGFHRIRHYGLFANGGRAENIARARQLLNVPMPQSETADADNTADGEPQALGASLPLLRRPHDHHRDLRARLYTAISTDRLDQDRQLMNAIALLSTLRMLAHRRRCLSAGHDRARPMTIRDASDRRTP